MTDKPTAAHWRDGGEPDPFGDRYDCERAELPGAALYSDDELANAQFLVRGEIHLQTIAKDRIRWLSRRVVKLEALLAERAARACEPL